MEQHPDYNAAFKKAYAGLNAAQKEAVDAIEGPVMVVAGPGTGKTQILSVRIGNILQQTDTQPENILCLTYTDAGTIAMRRRLLRSLVRMRTVCRYKRFMLFVMRLFKAIRTSLESVTSTLSAIWRT